MKRLLMMLITLFIIYMLIEAGFKYFGNGHHINYQLKENGKYFYIEEIHVDKVAHEKNGYYFKIGVDNTEFVFQTYEDFSRGEQIIQSVKYLDGNKYKCILPLFLKERVVSDIMCLDNGIIKYYHQIKGLDKEVDEFVTTLNLKKYKDITFSENLKDTKVLEQITAYTNNILPNHFVMISNYNGLTTINDINLKTIHQIKLFENDVYKKSVEGIIGKYYVVPDYVNEYEYNTIFVTDFTNNKRVTIKMLQKISYNSYLQGIIDKDLYIVDRENKKQYKIDINKGITVEIGNMETGAQKYSDGNFERVEMNQVLAKENLFDIQINSISDNNYYKIDKVGTGLTGYTYYYKRVNDIYEVYRAPNRSLDKKTLLLKTSNINDVNYYDDYLYFKNGNLIMYYHDNKGLKTIFKNEELDFNNQLKYGVYIKK